MLNLVLTGLCSAIKDSTMRRSISARRGLWLCALALLMVACWWQIRQLGDPRDRLPSFYTWFAAAGAVYGAALWVVRQVEQERPARRVEWAWLAPLLLAAWVARGTMVAVTPTLSEDIYRYRWDGRVQWAGLDPYAYPPNHPALQALRDATLSRINFPHLRTIYPPLTERAFQLGVLLGDSLTSQKLVFLCAELLTMASLTLLVLCRGRSPLWVLAYAWHPLPILEIAGSGHNDALGVAWLWTGILAWQVRWRGGCALAWAAAFLSKFTSIILAPWWWFRREGRGELAAFLLLSLTPIVCSPTLAIALRESLSAMASRFESNASAYLFVTWLLHDPAAARVVVGGLWIGWLLWWARREADPAKYVMLGCAAAALLTPVLHPWYLLWLIPGFCLWRVPALMVWTGTVVLAYTVWPGYLAGGRWRMPGWAHVLEYAPVVLLGLWELRRVLPSAARARSAAVTRPT